MDRTIYDGDLVRVSHLGSSMLHFDVMVGVVTDCNDRGSFFIQRIDSHGKPVPSSRVGWYSEENVTLLEKDYIHRGVQKDVSAEFLAEQQNLATNYRKEVGKIRDAQWKKMMGGK